MDVLLNEEEELLKASVRNFLARECPTSLVREMEEDGLGYPPSLWRQAADLGWTSIVLPEEYGGAGAPLTHLGLILEECGRGVAPVPLLSTMVAALTILRIGTDEQRARVLPRVASGELILTWAVIERDPRFLSSSVKCGASPVTGGFKITGEKWFVDDLPAAAMCLVACRTAAASETQSGVSLFLVDTTAPGVTQTHLPNMASDRQSRLTLEDVTVSADALVGEMNNAWPAIEEMVDLATVLLCTQMVGATRKAVDMAVDYAKDRVAFGRPIGAFQAIAHICADIVTWVDGATLLTYEALWRLAEGMPSRLHVATAKAFCNARCQMCLHQANQIHGGLSQIKDYDLNLWFRRAAAWSMRLGTTFDHHRTIARAVLN